jgi:hypothetical protein
MRVVRSRGVFSSYGATQQSLAADGAIAWFSSNFLLRGLNADRAPQLKAVVGHLTGLIQMHFSAQTATVLLMTTSVFLAVAGGGIGRVMPRLEPRARKATPSASAIPATVAYCDLLRHPDSYDRKVIRVKGIYSSHFEMSALRDPNCSKDFLWTWVDFDDQYAARTKQEVLQSFQAAVDSKRPERVEADLDKAKVVLIGLFEVASHSEIRNKILTNGYGHMGMYKFRLTVNCIEEVKPLPGK